MSSAPVPDKRRDLRVSDDDRDRVAAVLRDAVGRGQLSLAEVDERLRTAYAALTRADLAAVTADLPQTAAPRPTAVREPAPSSAPAPAAWRPWLAAGHLLFFWPVFPIGSWGLSILARASGARSGHGCGAVSVPRS
jgi:hypothetical protein